jgi:hypothetical protein
MAAIMARISSNPRTLNKTLLCIYCMFMVIVLVTSVVDWWHLRKTSFFFYFVLFLILGAVVWAVSYAMTYNLVDEVLDDGDSLLVRFRGEEERIPFSNIDDVTQWNARPPRITLRLATPCKFGERVSFMPKSRFTLNPFWMNPIVKDLLRRAQKARGVAAA